MPCLDAETALATLNSVLAGPKLVRGDAGEVEQFDLKDLIEAIKFLQEQCASNDAASNPRLGIRFAKLIPDGTL